MSEDNDPQSHDLLEEAIAAFARMGVPQRPPDQSLVQLLKASSPPSRPARRIPIFERIRIMNPVVRYAVAVCIMVIVAFVVLLRSGGDADKVAFAEVYNAVKEHQIARFTAKHEVEGGHSIEQKVYIQLDLRRLRMEGPGGTLNITDYRKRKSLLVNPTRKTAMIVDLPEKGHPDPLLEQLEETRNNKETVVTREKLGGQEMLVYRLLKHGKRTKMTIWVEPESKLPVRMEFVSTAAAVARTPRVVYCDFAWDPKVDEFFFSVKPPDGYEVTREPLPAKEATSQQPAGPTD